MDLAALVLLAGLPFLLSAAAAVAHRRHHRGTQPHLRDAAGTWLGPRAARVGVKLSVHDGPDAYWPNLDTIGLSRKTFHGRRPVDHAVAAHELGHALNARAHPLLFSLLPMARLAGVLLWRGFVGALFVATLFAAGWVLDLAFFLAAFALLANLIVVADEGMASLRAARWVRDEHAIDSLVGAWSVYAAIAAGQAAVLLSWGWVGHFALGGAGVEPVAVYDAPAVWLLVFLLPVLALRAASVFWQVVAPQPVWSEFRLFQVVHQEAQWEFLTGLSVGLLVLLLHDHATGPLFVGSMVLAAGVAVGPLSAIGRALVLFPLALILGRGEDEWFGEEPSPDHGSATLMAVYSDPPWYLRVHWLAQIAYVPMLVVLVVQLSGG